MGLKIENVADMDCNTIANGIMCDLADFEQAEDSISLELTSEELLRIDCAILSSLRETKDFSRDLLHSLESGFFEDISVKPPQGIENEIKDVQQEIMSELTLPLQNMFNQMEGYIVEALTT